MTSLQVWHCMHNMVHVPTPVFCAMTANNQARAVAEVSLCSLLSWETMTGLLSLHLDASTYNEELLANLPDGVCKHISPAYIFHKAGI